ncbi:ras-related protein Rab-3B isoform 2-T4 [Thomomys bottae]
MKPRLPRSSSTEGLQIFSDRQIILTYALNYSSCYIFPLIQGSSYLFGEEVVEAIDIKLPGQSQMDTAGQERYRTITTAYYRGAMGFILMYDITNEESFNAVQDWATQIKTYSWDNAQVILVGNKCDMEEERVVPTEKGRLLAEQLGFDFFEASAKENISVRQAFERLVDAICDKMSDSLDTDPSVMGTAKNTRLSDTPPLLQQNCSC